MGPFHLGRQPGRQDGQALNKASGKASSRLAKIARDRGQFLLRRNAARKSSPPTSEKAASAPVWSTLRRSL